MANFKHRRPRKSRAGCGMCKPQKKLGNHMRTQLGHKGFGKLRNVIIAEIDEAEGKEYDLT